MSPLPQPSRLVLNMGILCGAVIGLVISQLRGSGALDAFIVTGVCCMLGAAVFSYGEVLLRRRRGRD